MKYWSKSANCLLPSPLLLLCMIHVYLLVVCACHMMSSARWRSMQCARCLWCSNDCRTASVW